MNRRRIGAWSLAALIAVACAAVSAQTAKPGDKADRAEVDKPVKDFTLKDLMFDPTEKDAKEQVSLLQYKDKKAVVLFFMSEKCSVTWRYEKRFGKLLQDAAKKDVAFMGVRCSANDTEEGIKKFVASRNFDVHVLNDAKGAMTDYFNVRATPTFAVIDKKGVLRYFGSFDDTPEESEVEKNFVPDAVKAVLTNGTVAVKTNRAFG